MKIEDMPEKMKYAVVKMTEFFNADFEYDLDQVIVYGEGFEYYVINHDGMVECWQECVTSPYQVFTTDDVDGLIDDLSADAYEKAYAPF